MKTLKYARVEQIKRINGSVNGNPNYSLVLDESVNDIAQEAISGQDCQWVERRTKSDISDSYGIIPNKVQSGSIIVYTLTKAGRIDGVEAVQ